MLRPRDIFGSFLAPAPCGVERLAKFHIWVGSKTRFYIYIMKKNRIVNRSELAAWFDKTLPTVDAWVRDGCPVVARAMKGRPWQFDLAAVADWREQRARDAGKGGASNELRDLQRRKLEAETEKAELDLAKAKGDVALIEDFERAQALVFAAIRTNVLNVPQRVVLQLLGETNETAFKEKLRVELAAALEQSATTQFSELIDDSTSG